MYDVHSSFFSIWKADIIMHSMYITTCTSSAQMNRGQSALINVILSFASSLEKAIQLLPTIPQKMNVDTEDEGRCSCSFACSFFFSNLFKKGIVMLFCFYITFAQNVQDVLIQGCRCAYSR